MAKRTPQPDDDQPENPVFIWDEEHPDSPVPDWLRDALDQAEADYREILRRQQTDFEHEDA